MTDHPQEHASLDDFADKVEASGYDKLRKPFFYISADSLHCIDEHRYDGYLTSERYADSDIAVYTQPQVDALIAEARAGWLPIETAPAIGIFLVYVPTERDGHKILTMNRRKNLTTIGSRFDFDCGKPTHWQPMLPYPKDHP